MKVRLTLTELEYLPASFFKPHCSTIVPCSDSMMITALSTESCPRLLQQCQGKKEAFRLFSCSFYSLGLLRSQNGCEAYLLEVIGERELYHVFFNIQYQPYQPFQIARKSEIRFYCLAWIDHAEVVIELPRALYFRERSTRHEISDLNFFPAAAIPFCPCPAGKQINHWRSKHHRIIGLIIQIIVQIWIRQHLSS